MRVLKFDTDLHELLSDPSYDPELVAFFALATFRSQGQQVAVTNSRTADKEVASVCTLETQS